MERREFSAVINELEGPGNLLLVTHQVNITALVGGGVASGNMVVVQPENSELTVIGRLTDVR